MPDLGQPAAMPSMSTLDAVALAWFAVAWCGYDLVIDRLLRRQFGSRTLKAIRAIG